MRNATIVASVVTALCFLIGSPRGQAEDSPARRSIVLIGQSGHVAHGQDVDVAIVIGGSLVIEGAVHGPAAAIGGDVDVRPGAVVQSGVYAVGGTLHVDGRAHVQGREPKWLRVISGTW